LIQEGSEGVCKARQIVTGTRRLWRPNRRCSDAFSPVLRKPIRRPNTLKPEDLVRLRMGVKLSLAIARSILAGESSVT
jgi:hypothetical protein